MTSKTRTNSLNQEIERKFLVKPNIWDRVLSPCTVIEQGYLSIDPTRSVRVRTLDNKKAFLTIKGKKRHGAGAEYEFPIPIKQANRLLETLCLTPLIQKLRCPIRHKGHRWEVDIFQGANEGLIMAEIELTHTDEEFVRPPWLGREVTGEKRYSNANLVTRPYTTWKRKI